MAKKKKRRRRPVDAIDYFINAHGWQHATMLLANQPERDLLQYPMAVAESFALELYLKCLHRVRRRYCHGHDIKDLFEKLSAHDRGTLTASYDKLVREHVSYDWAVSQDLMLDLASVLHRTKDIFSVLRYWHEGNPPSVDAVGNFSNAGASSLAQAVIYRILEIRPEWERIGFRVTTNRAPSTLA